MIITRKQLTKLIRESAKKHNTKSVDKLMKIVLTEIGSGNTSQSYPPSTFAGHSADLFSDINNTSSTSNDGISVGITDTFSGTASSLIDHDDDEDDVIDEDEEMLDEDEEDIEEGEY